MGLARAEVKLGSIRDLSYQLDMKSTSRVWKVAQATDSARSSAGPGPAGGLSIGRWTWCKGGLGDGFAGIRICV